jgi:NOT2 / NOT3 / NOT5 family
MRDLNETLKNIRNSEFNDHMTLSDIEGIAENVSKPGYTSNTRSSPLLNRMLPECYTTFTFNNVNIKNLHEETLFYIFYAMNDSDLQIKAYNELISKGYLFSKMLDGFVMLGDIRMADNKKRNVVLFDPCDDD